MCPARLHHHSQPNNAGLHWPEQSPIFYPTGNPHHQARANQRPEPYPAAPPNPQIGEALAARDSRHFVDIQTGFHNLGLLDAWPAPQSPARRPQLWHDQCGYGQALARGRYHNAPYRAHAAPALGFDLTHPAKPYVNSQPPPIRSSNCRKLEWSRQEAVFRLL